MRTSSVLPSSCALLALIAAPMSAQITSIQVTVAVPVQLTKLSPDLKNVVITCVVRSDAIPVPGGTGVGEVTKQLMLEPANGEIRQTATFVFAFNNLESPAGKSATVECSILGFSAGEPGYQPFSTSATNPTLRLDKTLGTLTQTFTW